MLFLKPLLPLLVFIFLVGCQFTPENAGSHISDNTSGHTFGKTSEIEIKSQLIDFNFDVERVGNDIVDLQLVLKDRNSFLSYQGHVKLLST